MKITVALLLLAAVSDAANPSSKSREKIEEKPEKRGLVEGSGGIEKRAPALPTAAPSGVEYAVTKQNLPDKSPSQQVYATPVPQISKFSDFLNGQGPAFQAAITSHLYSPFSVYNPRFEAPPSYEVSAPVPSQLAYTEHRLTMPSTNSLQYSSKPQKLGKPITYPQPQVVTQQSYEQQNLGYEPLLHQLPNNGIHNFQAIQYNQAPQGYIEQQQLQYLQDPSNQVIPTNIQQHPVLNKNQHLEQRDLKNQPTSAQILEKQNIQQVSNNKPQTALSFARFIYNPPLEASSTTYDQYKNQQLHTQSSLSQPQSQPQLQPQHQIQPQFQTQQIIQSQPQQYQAQSQPLPQIQYELQHPTQLPQMSYRAPQELQYQTSQQLQYQPQPQIQYQEEQPQFYQQFQSQFLQPQALPQNHIQTPQYQFQTQNYQLQQTQPQYFEKSEPIAKQSVVSEKQYFKQSQIQPQLSPQIFPQQQIQNSAYKQPVAIPTFPPVQYFGKFAQSIFANSQQ